MKAKTTQDRAAISTEVNDALMAAMFANETQLRGIIFAAKGVGDLPATEKARLLDGLNKLLKNAIKAKKLKGLKV